MTTLGTPEEQAALKQYLRDLHIFNWSERPDEGSLRHIKRMSDIESLRIQQRKLDPNGDIWLTFKPTYCGPFPDVDGEKA